MTLRTWSVPTNSRYQTCTVKLEFVYLVNFPLLLKMDQRRYELSRDFIGHIKNEYLGDNATIVY